MFAAKIAPDSGDFPAFDLLAPAAVTVPLVFASPHSGQHYPADFLSAAALDPLALRRSEDSFVDEIFGAAPRHGAPLLRANFARAYCDANREPYELDPAMFEDLLPDYANTTSVRVAGGLGTIARTVGVGGEIYRRKLTFAEAKGRIERCYHPYHAALRELLATARARFGYVLLIDCHSMPSVGGPTERDQGRLRPDIVLGDRFGSACAPELIAAVERILGGLGYRVGRNRPYAGGYTTYHYGRPAVGQHVLQIEINRALYMDEARIERGRGLPGLSADMTRLIRGLAALPAAPFQPDPSALKAAGAE